ncbi:hypothetical protein M2389_001590 [Microbacterium phyllosphaerae]|nr:hypothetical protein [Microbacterium phyllosphaerae]
MIQSATFGASSASINSAKSPGKSTESMVAMIADQRSARGDKYLRILHTDHPCACVSDVDGTLALIGDRSPYGMRNVSINIPNHPIVVAQTFARIPRSTRS